MTYHEEKAEVNIHIKNATNFLVPASGSFEVQLDDGKVKKKQ